MDGAIYGLGRACATLATVPEHRSLELQAAVRARTVDQRRRGATRRARQVLGVGINCDLDGREALAREAVPPVVV
jgi:hypothetical protein